MRISILLVFLIPTMTSIYADTGNQTNSQNNDTRSLVLPTWVLAGGTITVGIVTIITLIKTNRTHERQIQTQDKQNKISAMMEVFKTLGDEEHRNARRISYLAKKEYDRIKDITIFLRLQNYKEVGITASHFNQIGMLIQKNIIP